MAFPEEQDSQEYNIAYTRAYREALNTVGNIAILAGNLPPRVTVLIYDEKTRIRFGGHVLVEYGPATPSGLKRVRTTALQMGELQGGNALSFADSQIKDYPDEPLVCDRHTADELHQGAIPWNGDGHFRLEGRPGGVLEVYVEYAATPDVRLGAGLNFRRILDE